MNVKIWICTVTFKNIDVQITTLNTVSGDSRNIQGACISKIDSSNSFTLNANTKYWFVFEYNTSPSSIMATDWSSSTLNSDTNFKMSDDGSTWYTSPHTVSGDCSGRSKNKRFRLFLTN